ncbi:MAG: hypothetical protein IKR73_07620 [Oscillospiraceae bacterium]|nr:hypothetical protein [Oscillospiraceae bacterium]
MQAGGRPPDGKGYQEDSRLHQPQCDDNGRYQHRQCVQTAPPEGQELSGP